MNEKTKELLDRLNEHIEQAEAERAADPLAYEQKIKENTTATIDNCVENLNKIDEFLKALEETPDDFTTDEAELNAYKTKLESNKRFYKELLSSSTAFLDYLNSPQVEEEEPDADTWQTLYTCGEYHELITDYIDGDKSAIEKLKALNYVGYEEDIQAEIDARLELRKANKELLNTLSDGNADTAEALLITATLEDYEKANITLNERQRNYILTGDTEHIKIIIADLLFTSLIKLWRIVSEKQAPLTPGALVSYNTIKPEKTAIAVSKVAQKLLTIEQEGASGVLVDVGTLKESTIKISAMMKYDDANISIKGRPLTEFDKTVHDGAAALYAAGNTTFTIQDLYRACNGLDIDQVEADTLKPYIDSLEASITRRLIIDATDQINAFYKSKVKKVRYENYFLPLKAVDVEMNNGVKVKGYAFLDAPPLYEYSSNIRQIVSAPIKLLSAKRMKNTPELATYTNYLIKRIDILKNPHNKINNHKIAYATIVSTYNVDYSGLDRTQQKRKRDLIKAKLDIFIANGYIKGYEEYKDGRAIAGVIIDC